MRNFKTTYASQPKPYRPRSNITGSYCIKKADEKDYLELRKFLHDNHISLGVYLVECYRELDKDCSP
jgi:hypothetical protein